MALVVTASDDTRPIPRPRPPQERTVYREEAVRNRVAHRAGGARVPVVISGPSFLVLWVLAAVVVSGAAVLTALALKAAS